MTPMPQTAPESPRPTGTAIEPVKEHYPYLSLAIVDQFITHRDAPSLPRDDKKPKGSEKLKGRIRKLLELSKSSNPNESQAASERALQLMLEHKLELKDVQKENGGDDDVCQKDIPGRKWKEPWRWSLLTSCCQAYYCSNYRIETRIPGTQRYRYVVTLIGTEEDIDTVLYFYNWLESETDRTAEEAVKKKIVQGAVELKSFRHGFVSELHNRLQALKYSFEQKEERALVISRRSEEKRRSFAEKVFKQEEIFRPDAEMSNFYGYGHTASEEGQLAAREVDLTSKKQKRIGEETGPALSFLAAYRRAQGKAGFIEPYWKKERDKFLAKNIAAPYALFDSEGNPTEWHLELIEWAYSPEPDKLKRLCHGA